MAVAAMAVAALASALASAFASATASSAPASADDSDPGWSPDYTVFPYNLWQSRVTPEQVVALRDSCQWFNANYSLLNGQSWGFQHYLSEQRDNWSAPGVAPAAEVVRTDLDRAAAFLDPRVRTLYITNYPDQSQYSPLYNGDSFYHLWFQFTQIADKIARRLPSGQINANNATMNVYGTVIRDSGVCDGA